MKHELNQSGSNFDNKTLQSVCLIYFLSKCQDTQIDLTQMCNSTELDRSLDNRSEFDAEVAIQNTLNTMTIKVKDTILSDPTDFVVSAKWDGMEQPVTGRGCEDPVTSFCAFYYQGAKQYIVNYLGELSTFIMGEKSGLEVILQVPQSYSGEFGIVQDMDAFFCDFVPPSYISGGKRIIIKPRTSVSIVLKQVRMSKLPSPFASNCIQNWNQTNFGDTTQEIIQKTDGFKAIYHPFSCHPVCQIHTIVLKCGCTLAKLDPGEFVTLYKVPGCPMNDTQTMNCIEDNILSMEETRKTCNCQDVCQVISYEVTHSISEWPALEVPDEAVKDKNIMVYNYTKPVDGITQLMERNRISGQQARVHIFFESNESIVIEQIAVFGSFWDFFNTLGGAVSIYLGVSMMALLGLILTGFERILSFSLKGCEGKFAVLWSQYHQ